MVNFLHLSKEIIFLIILIIQYFLFLFPLALWCKKWIFWNCKNYFKTKFKWLWIKKFFIYVIGWYFITLFVMKLIYLFINRLNSHWIYVPFFWKKENAVHVVSKIMKEWSIYLKILMFLTVTIIWPMVEEIIYRSFITEFLLKRKNSIISVILWSFIFAFVHFEWNVMWYLFFLGLYLWIIWYKTRSLVYTFLAHFLINFITFLILTFFPYK